MARSHGGDDLETEELARHGLKQDFLQFLTLTQRPGGLQVVWLKEEEEADVHMSGYRSGWCFGRFSKID